MHEKYVRFQLLLSKEQKQGISGVARIAGASQGEVVRTAIDDLLRGSYDTCPSCKTMFPHGKSCGCGGKG